MRTKGQLSLVWGSQILAAIILGQTLFFKFSGAEESIYIFTTLGIEPWGRYLSAVAELIAVILLLIPKVAYLGAILSLGVISGAIMSHLTQLGIVVKDDGGLLFGLAITVFLSNLVTLFLRRTEIPILGKKFK